MKPKVPDQDFVDIVNNSKSIADAARVIQTGEREVYSRKKRMEERGFIFASRVGNNGVSEYLADKQRTINLEIENGYVIVGSDAHYVKGVITPAHLAFCWLTAELKPKAVILNGDIMDNSSISAHHRIGWEKQPTVKEELETVQTRLDEIESVAGSAKLFRTWGNHDIRFDGRLSSQVPQYEGVFGCTLDDHLPKWKSCWSLMVNKHTLIKHRIRGGIHAVWNNMHASHTSTVTGHLHKLEVKPFTHMAPTNNGCIYGVDTGTLADPWADTFAYLEEGPRNWRSGFAVLTFVDGILMPPELCQIVDGQAWFRGRLHDWK